MSGFRKFLVRGNVIDVAVAFVMGVAFTAIVTAVVGGLITPLVTAIAGKPSFSNLHFELHHSVFMYGTVINALISFVLIGLVVYFLIVAPVSRLMTLTDRHKETTERECPECLSQIPIAATRCKFCTATVRPVGQPARAETAESA